MCYREFSTVNSIYPRTSHADIGVFASPLYVDELGEMHPR